MKEHITIAGQIFIAPIRYLPGHVMTEEEADTFSKFVNKKAYQSLNKKKGLTQEELDRWVANHQVGARTRPGRDPTRFTVKNLINELERNNGRKFSVKEYNKMMTDPKILKIAQRRLEDITTLAAADLRDG